MLLSDQINTLLRPKTPRLYWWLKWWQQTVNRSRGGSFVVNLILRKKWSDFFGDNGFGSFWQNPVFHNGPEEFSAQVGPARENFETESARPGRIFGPSPGEFWTQVGPARPEEKFSKSYIIVWFPRLIRDFLNRLWRFKATFEFLPLIEAGFK